MAGGSPLFAVGLGNKLLGREPSPDWIETYIQLWMEDKLAELASFNALKFPAKTPAAESERLLYYLTPSSLHAQYVQVFTHSMLLGVALPVEPVTGPVIDLQWEYCGPWIGS